MDVPAESVSARLGIPRPQWLDAQPGLAPVRSVAEVMEHIPLVDADGHAIRWTRRNCAYLADLLWRIAHGRLTG